ncbi:MAG TPA: hypothetical protein VMG12_13885 [Polyangiaceae bacterium]|nr:hypothetical protein [Polyangiaceae bacterium]
MSSSALGGGSPRRLFLHGGKWVLEVVRHVNLGHDLIRPTTQRLTGQRAITSYFKNNPDKASLGKATLRLIANEIVGETRSYVAEGADWIANSMPPPRGDRLDSERAPPEPPTLETVVGQLEAKVVVLTAVQEGLLTRLARLEAKMARGTFVASGSAGEARAELRPSSSRALADSESEAESGSESEAEPGSESEAESGSESMDESESADAPSPSLRGGDAGSDAEDGGAPAGAEPDAAEGDEPDEVEPPPPPGTPPRIQLTLPPVSELAKCVVLLIGGDVTVKEGDPPFAVNRTTKDCYAASILDDHDQTIGAIVMDLKAAVFLGGTLMMLPRTEIEQQLKSLSPGEDSIAASAEICNALSGAINGSQEQHVRVGRLEKFEFKSWSWVTSAADRRDLEDSFGGRTVLFSRPPPAQIS